MTKASSRRETRALRSATRRNYSITAKQPVDGNSGEEDDPMTDPLIEQIKADAEKGTRGNWRTRPVPCGNNIYADDTFVCSVRSNNPLPDHLEKQMQIDARRIARVPAMEARILADAEKKAARQWQPIETAPKDGSWVLGYRKGYRYGKQTMFTVRYWPHNDQPPFWFSNMNGWPQPTHWMPLPSPPASPGDNESAE